MEERFSTKTFLQHWKIAQNQYRQSFHVFRAIKLRNESNMLKVKGVVFDSAPGRRRIVSLFRAISAIIGGNMFYNLSMSILMTMFISMIWIYEVTSKNVKNHILKCLFQVVTNAIHPRCVVQTNPLENLKDEKCKWPQHFIYSKADDLIPYTVNFKRKNNIISLLSRVLLQDIEYFAKYRRELGIDVTTLCYESSLHVKHLPENRTSYVTSVYNFVNKCLNGKLQ